MRVAIAGPPNAGKSTLLNALAERRAAIVSPIAGTTRDLIEVPVAIAGVPFLLTDTAGLRSATDAIEREGVMLAEQALAESDVLLWLGAPNAAPARAAVVRLATKSDLGGDAAGAELAISAVTGAGMEALRQRLLDEACVLLPAEDAIALNLRQREALGDAERALQEAAANSEEPLIAHLLHEAAAAFDRAIGRTATEDMLDALFGSLCIGK